MTAPIDAVSGLVEELRALSAYPGDAYDRAADALEAQARELAEKDEDIKSLMVIHRADYAEYETVKARAEAAECRIAALEDAVRVKDERAAMLERVLRDARENMEHWASYASNYFREKHRLADDLSEIDTALAKGQNALVSGREDGA